MEYEQNELNKSPNTIKEKDLAVSARFAPSWFDQYLSSEAKSFRCSPSTVFNSAEGEMNACRFCGATLAADTRLCEFCGAATELRTNVTVSAVESSAAADVVSSSGERGSKAMDTKLAGALTYLAGFVTGIVFLLLDPYKSNCFVRFHAFQSIFFNVAWIGFWIVWIILSAVLTPLTAGSFRLIAGPIVVILTLAGFGIWVLLMCEAYQQKLFSLPILGKFAAERAGVRL